VLYWNNVENGQKRLGQFGTKGSEVQILSRRPINFPKEEASEKTCGAFSLSHSGTALVAVMRNARTSGLAAA
jgi:hypothetical protein